jgi:hypothetical protein
LPALEPLLQHNLDDAGSNSQQLVANR